MTRAKSSVVFLCLLLAVALCVVPGSYAKEAPGQAKVLKIGLIVSLTGPMAPGFKSMADAAKPAGDVLNKRGGIMVKGQKYMVEFVTEDDQSSPAGAVAAANKLMQQGIKFLIPPLFVPSNMAVAPITEEAKILRVKVSGMTKDEIGPNLHYSFFANSTTYSIGPSYDYLKKNYPGVKRIAIINADDPAAKILREMTEKEIQMHGLELVFKDVFKIGTEDYYPILTKALEKKPDAIDIMFGAEPWAVGIVNQSRELGFTGPIFASGIFGDINRVNSMLNPKYAYDVFEAAADVLSPKMPAIVKEFRALVKQQTKAELDITQAMLLEALHIMLQGIQKAQSFDTDKVASTLETMKSIDTIWGPGRIGGQEFCGVNHLVRRAIPISRIMKNKVEFELLDRD